jgi:hypothetical protein
MAADQTEFQRMISSMAVPNEFCPLCNGQVDWAFGLIVMGRLWHSRCLQSIADLDVKPKGQRNASQSGTVKDPGQQF